MNKKDYKRLGDYIREVDVRNKDLKVKQLMGININKLFMPSVANVIGTDLSNYKIVREKQFACNLMHVGRDGKLPIAICDIQEGVIVSPAYYVFEIKDTEEILPEYLMMWFSRSEFDREASFFTDSDVRGGLDKISFNNMCLPIPPIEKQRKIVSDYETLTKRIKHNEKIIHKLEEIAHTIYSKIFRYDINNLPKDWEIVSLCNICEINTENISYKDSIEEIKYIDTSSVTNNIFKTYQILNIKKDLIPSRAKRKVRYNDIIYSTVRPNLKHYGIIKNKEKNIIVSTGFIVIRSKDIRISNELLYLWLTNKQNTDILQNLAEMSKATYPSITPQNIMDLKISLPRHTSCNMNMINMCLKNIYNYIYLKHIENKKILKNISIILGNK